jgi:hypothetical protein
VDFNPHLRADFGVSICSLSFVLCTSFQVYILLVDVELKQTHKCADYICTKHYYRHRDND